jgi:hypothetical protein
MLPPSSRLKSSDLKLDLVCFSETLVQWAQNNSELALRHNKRGSEDGKGKGEQMVKSLSEHV